MGNSWFVTRKKRRIGVCQEIGYVKRGDMVCVLLGLRVPIVLRKVDNHYVVVREVYVSGLVKGEAIDMLEAGQCQFEDFVLH